MPAIARPLPVVRSAPVACPVPLLRARDVPHAARVAARGELVSVVRGVYAPTGLWRQLAPWDRYLARIHATLLTHPGLVLSHESAAAIWGMPVLGDPGVVHALGDPSRTSRLHAGLRMHTTTGARDVVDLGGFAAIAPADCAVDLARARHVVLGLIAADAALRLDPAATVESLVEQNEHRPSSRGATSPGGPCIVPGRRRSRRSSPRAGRAARLRGTRAADRVERAGRDRPDRLLVAGSWSRRRGGRRPQVRRPIRRPRIVAAREPRAGPPPSITRHPIGRALGMVRCRRPRCAGRHPARRGHPARRASRPVPPRDRPDRPRLSPPRRETAHARRDRGLNPLSRRPCASRGNGARGVRRRPRSAGRRTRGCDRRRRCRCGGRAASTSCARCRARGTRRPRAHTGAPTRW